MSEELTIFRQNRLAYLRQKYNADCARFYSNLANNVNSIQKARNTVRNKQQLVNNAVNQYYKDVNTLAAIYNQNKYYYPCKSEINFSMSSSANRFVLSIISFTDFWI